LWHNEFDRATIKLTFYYVLSTAVILFVSSVAVLVIFAPPETEIPFVPESSEQIEIEHDDWSLYEVSEHLAFVIFIVDVTVLFFVSIVSYFFAQRTLLPIKKTSEKHRQFMADVAHELRTPLSVLQSGADTMLRKDRDACAYKTFVTDVQEESSRLTRTTNQLLQLLKTGSVKSLKIVTVAVSDVLQKEVRRFDPYARERGVVLTSNISPAITINSDQDALIEIVQNLLKNAVDYSNKNDTVTVSLKEHDASVEIIIADTGVGIEEEQQVRIFDRFHKISSARTQDKHSGAGLGLAIVHALVTRLGGHIVLQSELQVGTKVTVTLPHTHS